MTLPAGPGHRWAHRDSPGHPEELLEQWRGALKAGARKLLDLLVAAYPGSLTRGQLAATAPATSPAAAPTPPTCPP